jgi:hypothetical protein
MKCEYLSTFVSSKEETINLKIECQMLCFLLNQWMMLICDELRIVFD